MSPAGAPPLGEGACDRILSQFAARCAEEAAGLIFCESDWAEWASAEEDHYI